MTSTYMVIELVVGNITNSMALVADSFHMMSDVIALLIAYVSVSVSPKEWKQNTFGWARAEVRFYFWCHFIFLVNVLDHKYQ